MSRRTWLAGVGAIACNACGRKPGTGYAGHALVATAGEETLAVIDLMQFRVNRPVALGAPPSLVVPAERGSAFALTPTTGCVHRIVGAQSVANKACLAPGLSGIRLSPDAKDIFGISPAAGEFVVAESSTLRTERRYALREKPRTMDVARLDLTNGTFGNTVSGMRGGETLVAISSGDAGSVELFDVGSGKRWHRKFDGPIADLRFRSDAQLLLVANRAGRSLTILSIPALDVVADLPLAMQPENLCFNRDQGQLFVTGDGMDAVAIVFPYRVLQVDQTVLAGRDPGAMACSENPSLLFVASASGSDVCVLHIDTRRVVGLVDITQHSGYITITPDDQYALMLCQDSGNVAFIRIPPIRLNPAVTRSKSGAALFTMLPVGRQPVHAAVVSRAT